MRGGSLRKGAIVCIDDERSVLLSLRDQLGWLLEHEYTVELAESGEEALALLEE
ncbi:MAG: response regulator [Synechococcales cyanobacterium RU_4_20]|nr:response regulator [Synechococcales cyanobacterium RU_4_20]